MADLTIREKKLFERLFRMSTGYVLDFSNRTFHEFVLDSTGRNIDDHSMYGWEGASKANRLRSFWEVEENHVVAKLLGDMLEHMEDVPNWSPEADHEKAKQVIDRLGGIGTVAELSSIVPNSGESEFDALARAVRDAIEKHQPETGLDRLHTFVVKYMRVVCTNLSVSFTKDEPLHSLFGKYVKHLRSLDEIESEMTERILKSNISILEEFNKVRNQQSLAHANPILNYEESLLIFNHVASAIRFVNSLERKRGSEAPILIQAERGAEALPYEGKAEPIENDDSESSQFELEDGGRQDDIAFRRRQLELIFDDEYEIEMHLRAEFS